MSPCKSGHASWIISYHEAWCNHVSPGMPLESYLTMRPSLNSSRVRLLLPSVSRLEKRSTSLMFRCLMNSMRTIMGSSSRRASTSWLMSSCWNTTPWTTSRGRDSRSSSRNSMKTWSTLWFWTDRDPSLWFVLKKNLLKTVIINVYLPFNLSRPEGALWRRILTSHTHCVKSERSFIMKT